MSNERLRYAGVFDEAGLPGVMETTVTLRAVFCGTGISVVQERIPEVIPVEACYLGRHESISLLTLLVEAEVRQ